MHCVIQIVQLLKFFDLLYALHSMTKLLTDVNILNQAARFFFIVVV